MKGKGIDISKSSLQQMLDHWHEIEKLHFDLYVRETTRRNDKLYVKAKSVVAALRHYMVELDEGKH